jgi:hypothetical protein
MARMYARMPLGSGATTWVSVTAVEGEWLHHSGDRRTLASRCFPQVGDPATAGCLLALLGPNACVLPIGGRGDKGYRAFVFIDEKTFEGDGTTRGRACVAVAEALGRWPGGQ